MSWLNLNQSLNSLKGQITNFATEVLSEGVAPDTSISSLGTNPSVKDLEEKCRSQELEIAALKKLTDEIQAALQSERLSRKNGVKEEEASWYWDPPDQMVQKQNNEMVYKQQIQALQGEISNLKEKDGDLKPYTEEEINRLREENKNLTSNLEDLDNQHQVAMERLLTLKQELQKNFEVLKQEHEDIKNSNNEYFNEVQNVRKKLSEKDEEIKHLQSSKSDYETLHHKYLNLEKVHTILRENAEKFQEENQELHEEIFKLQEQVTKLEHEIEINTKHSELSNVVPRERYEELMREVSDLKSRRNSDLHLDEINIDDNAKSVIENLKRDIHELKHKLSQKEEQTNLDILDHRTVKSEKIMQLYNKYVNFELPVDYIGEIPSSNDNIVLFKLESAFKTLNSFKKEIDTLDHKLSEKNHDMNHLQTQIDDLTTENDFLTTDLQHYERELKEMKKNNDFLISEIAALKNTSKLEPIIETHEDNLAKLETELADSNRINKTFESEINRIEIELNEVRTEKAVLQESLIDLKHKYTTMLAELETCKTQSKAVEELELSAITSETDKLNKALSEITELKNRLISANSKNEQLSIDIHIIENDKVLLTKEIDDLKHILERKISSLHEMEILKESLSNKIKDLEKHLEDVTTRNKTLEDEKNNLEKKMGTFSHEFTKVDNSETLTELEKLSAENLKLSSKLSETLIENSTLQLTIDKLKDEISYFEKTSEELLKENMLLKNSSDEDRESKKLLEKTAEELKAKIIKQEVLNNEHLDLKDEYNKTVQSKLQLEVELRSTDNKIKDLETEFEKFVLDLNEKDSIIDSLNTTIAKNNVSLNDLSNNVTDLSKSVEVKNTEILRLTESLKISSDELHNITEKINHYNEELTKVNKEKEDMNQQILTLYEDLASKNFEISSVTSNLQELQSNYTFYKSASDTKDKEIKELNQSIVELRDKIKGVENISHQNDDYAKLAQEKETIDKNILYLKNSLATQVTEITELQVKCEQFERACLEYKTLLENATKEKTELINLVNLKHNESIQYHNEIQRLNHVLLEQSNEFKKIIEEKDTLLVNKSESCTNCENLRITLKEKDEIIRKVNQSSQDRDKLETELVNIKEHMRSLTERCGNLDRNLSIQLDIVEKLTAEKSELSAQEQNSTKELERLRRHLVETEENYTQELMISEQKLVEVQTRLHQIEERAKQTSTVYTSNSIRANQEVETLRNQIKLLEKQREEAQGRLSEAEDSKNRSEAAVTNLQVVLEQFQLDKERDIHTATEKLRNKMEDVKRENRSLLDEIARLNVKLEESLAGLQAATRLGDQVESKTAQINDLKDQVRTLQTSVTAAEERYYNAISNQQDKVDKNLIKNLVINYVMTSAQNTQNKTQVLRVLSTVLDFNQQECERLGLVRAANTTDSLAAEFVKFLQNESRPRAPLPNMMGLASNSSRSTTPTSRKSSVLGPQPELGHTRNPSTGSNNLLFQNIESLETSSQISIESDREPRRGPNSTPPMNLATVVEPRIVGLDTGVNQTRNTEGAILKYVLKDM